MYKDRKRIISNGYVMIQTVESCESPNEPMFDELVYEHREVAEEMIDRPLKEGEVVHHLDSRRSNNSPENLLVLSGPMHAKLHSWLDKNTIKPNPEYEERTKLGCIRCLVCEKPINSDFKFCSKEHSILYQTEADKRYKHPSKEELEKLVWEKPTVQVAKDFNVSDKAIENLCKKLEVVKPPRGYWAKKKAEKV